PTPTHALALSTSLSTCSLHLLSANRTKKKHESTLSSTKRDLAVVVVAAGCSSFFPLFPGSSCRWTGSRVLLRGMEC
ncbi:unnamed protein product, partial [Musa banksii]